MYKAALNYGLVGTVRRGCVFAKHFDLCPAQFRALKGKESTTLLGDISATEFTSLDDILHLPTDGDYMGRY
jgi:hypothetical protein